jgi:hypothetical protein
MKVVKVRSPFIVEVADQGVTHTGSKIVLTVWNNGNSEPTFGQAGYYSLSKTNPSTTQRATSYNVSNYVKEFITNIEPQPLAQSFTQAENEIATEWCKFRVRKYWYNGTTYTEIGSGVLYFGVNGFENYTNGNQNPVDTKLLLLSNADINHYYNLTLDYPTDPITSTSYYREETINVMYDKLSTDSFSVRWETLSGGLIFTQNISSGVASSGNLKIPVSLLFSETGATATRLIITMTWNSGIDIIQYLIESYQTDECKYQPVRCTFINRYGGWQDLVFFKAQTNSIAVKGTDYKLTQSAINYNTAIGQFQTFNINGKQTVKLNTGWVEENYSELISDILLSETVLLNDVPVTVKSQSTDFKTNLKDKNINYELEFEYAFNLINDVI